MRPTSLLHAHSGSFVALCVVLSAGCTHGQDRDRDTSLRASDTASDTASAMASVSTPPTLRVETPRELYGTCDASAGVALDANRFVIASDEDDTLRVYDLSGKDSMPVQKVALDKLLDPVSTDGEADLEGAAQVGDTIFWIGSQGNNKKAKPRPRRRVLLATVVRTEGSTHSLEPVGRAYGLLRDDLLAAASLGSYGLAEAATQAPEPTGLNIEGFAPAGTGEFYLGFRSPRPGDKALVVRFRAGDVLSNTSARASIVGATTLDLGGYGVRSMEPLGNGTILLAAGPSGDDGTTRLYEWTPAGSAAPQPVTLEGFDSSMTIEGLAAAPDGQHVLLIADDGGRPVDASGACKDGPKARLRFRVARATLATHP